MIDRCYKPTHPSYKYYGGQHVRVCERWLKSFDNFLADMGERPINGTLDRIDNYGDYEPENCRWATWRTQALNRKKIAIDNAYDY